MSQSPISISQVASSVPFDKTGINFNSDDVQATLQEVRDHSVMNSETRATTAAGTATLTVSNLSVQYITGTATGYNMRLPDATTLFLSQQYQIINDSSQPVQIKDGSGTNLFLLGQTSTAYITLQLNGTAAGKWTYWQAFNAVASGIVSYNLISGTTFSTTSSTDVAVTGFTLTPQAGTYAIWLSGQASATGAGVDCAYTLYKGAAAITDTVRTNTSTTGGHNFILSTTTIVQFDGVTAVSLKINTTGNMSIGQRSMLLIRLGT